jgi:aryl-alcohol dehydrogenase-like predicted oxidoreductase
MASGLLSGGMTRERIAAMPEDDWQKRSANFRRPALTCNLRLMETVRTVGQRYNVTPGAVAIAWTLRNPAVTGTIVGVRSAQQVDGVIGAAAITQFQRSVGNLAVPEAAGSVTVFVEQRIGP